MTAYERARDDPAFLRRFTEAYQGRVDPLDALWWREHPDEAAPSGAPAPAAPLAELRRAVYAPGSSADVTERYERLRSELERERAAVAQALAVAEVGPPVPTVPLEVPVSGAEPPPPAARSRRPLLLAAAATIAAFAAGLLVAPAVGRGAAAPQATASPTPVETAPFISGSSGSGSALGIFGEPQRDVDRPSIDVAARLLPQTFRRLRSVPWRGVEVFAAQDAAGDVCLVALFVDARLAAACTPVAGFQRRPLQLSFRADVYRDAATTTGQVVEMTATWSYLGRFRLDEGMIEQ